MKILFFVGILEENLNASSKIVYNVAQRFSKDYDVHLMGLSQIKDKYELKDRLTVSQVLVKDIFLNSNSKLEKFLASQMNASRQVGVKKFILRHPISALLIEIGYRTKLREAMFTKTAKKTVDKLMKKEKFTHIVMAQEPYFSIESAIDIKNCKKIIYQLDPHGLNVVKQKNEKEKRIKIENENFEKADIIFTTPVLYDEYINLDGYKKFKSKYKPIEFPNINRINKEKSIIDFDKNYINITFCGTLEDGYRSPKIFLDSIKDFKDKVRVYFVGDILSKTAKEYAKKENNIFVHDRVSAKQAFGILQESDFLLNIGNNIYNQVPSKIFDYFSLGKPIINLQKLEECPAECYFKKYPLVFTMKSLEKERLFNFLTEYKGKTIDFEDVKKIFNDATLEGVYNIMKNTILENE